MTLSAYDVVFSPAVAARSLRVQGTTTTAPDSGGGACSPAVTRYVRPDASVAARSDPSGPTPAVTV
jgi:hypothetical protein